MSGYRILAVGDEEGLCKILKFNLENGGYEVNTANPVEEAIKMDTSSHHLILLDVMMGEIPGLKMANILKKDERIAKVSAILITAENIEGNTMAGLNLGVDDYTSGPFSLYKVIAHVRAVLRHTVTTETKRVPERLTYQSLVTDITKKKVGIDDEEVPLTRKGFETLLLLVQNKGCIFSYEDILIRTWNGRVYVLDRTVDIDIIRPRRRIGVHDRCVITRLGYGYCLEAE